MGPVANCCTSRDEKENQLPQADGAPVATITTKEKVQ